MACVNCTPFSHALLDSDACGELYVEDLPEDPQTQGDIPRPCFRAVNTAIAAWKTNLPVFSRLKPTKSGPAGRQSPARADQGVRPTGGSVTYAACSTSRICRNSRDFTSARCGPRVM